MMYDDIEHCHADSRIDELFTWRTYKVCQGKSITQLHVSIKYKSAKSIRPRQQLLASQFSTFYSTNRIKKSNT